MAKKSPNQQCKGEFDLKVPKDLSKLSGNDLKEIVNQKIKIENHLAHEYSRRIEQVLKANKIDPFTVDGLEMEMHVPDQCAIGFELVAEGAERDSKALRDETALKLKKIFGRDLAEAEQDENYGSIKCQIGNIESYFK